MFSLCDYTFPLYFSNNITLLETSNIKPSTSHNHFYASFSWFWLGPFKFFNFPVFSLCFSKILNSLCFPCLELLFPILPVFPVEWETWFSAKAVSVLLVSPVELWNFLQQFVSLVGCKWRISDIVKCVPMLRGIKVPEICLHCVWPQQCMCHKRTGQSEKKDTID